MYFFGDDLFDRNYDLAAYLNAHSPMPFNRLTAARAAVADEDGGRGISIREWAEGAGADDADSLTDDDELASDSEEAEEKNNEKKEAIRKLREENEQSSALRFSRACTACHAAEPRRRAVFIACGHAVCRECADAAASRSPVSYWAACPNCENRDRFVQLYEEEADDGPGFSRACVICVTDHPRARAYFTRCGHIICLACAYQLEADADADAYETDDDEDEIQVSCPMCKTEGTFEELKERLEAN